jgi:hypothetical protein
MIRAPVSNAVVFSILFSVLAGGGMLLVCGKPNLPREGAAQVYCELHGEDAIAPLASAQRLTPR